MSLDKLLNKRYKVKQLPKELKWEDEQVKVYKLGRRRKKFTISTDNHW